MFELHTKQHSSILFTRFNLMEIINSKKKCFLKREENSLISYSTSLRPKDDGNFQDLSINNPISR